MNQKIQHEKLMKDILELIKKQSLPVQSLSLDISFLTDDFEELFPHLKTYKAGRFYKPLEINGIPVALTARRRIPLAYIIEWLRENVYPYLEQTVREIEQEFENIQAILRIIDDQNSKFAFKHNFRIEVECRLKSEPTIEEGNTVLLSVGVRQFNDTSSPIVFGFVGWLVDKESGDDWGIDTVSNINQLDLDVNESQLSDIKTRKLPHLRQTLLNELSFLINEE